MSLRSTLVNFKKMCLNLFEIYYKSSTLRRRCGKWRFPLSPSIRCSIRVGDFVSALVSDDGDNRGWDYLDRGDDYIHNMAQAIIEGRFAANRLPTYRAISNDPDLGDCF